MAQSVRDRLRTTIESRWNALLDSFDGLTDAQMVEPGVVGDWSVKDVLAHITTWEAEALHHLPAIAEGKKPPTYASRYGSLDEFNARKFEENHARSLDEVRERLLDVHTQLLAYLETVPDELLHSKQRFRSRLRWDTYSHYAMHTAHIREWRAE
ncbi:MAG: ClbS/DfsB family four-helix bundle protein [Thermomicrobiales bacterium]|nr:ClbS/DfsB family four-helix bundle protein [Thermomicrobiales bacterium]